MALNKVSLLSVRNNMGQFVGSVAQKWGWKALADMLIQDDVQHHDWDVIHFAAHQNKLQLLQHLCSEDSSQFNKRTNSGFTPIMLATLEGHLEVFNFLRNSADLDARDSQQNSILHNVVNRSQIGTKSEEVILEMATTLLSLGVPSQIGDINGVTPLHIAAELGLNNVIALLLEKGAEVNSTDVKNSTPLFCACKNKLLATAELLLQRGANPNIFTTEGTTPLILATIDSQLDFVTLLLKNGADPNIANKEKATPLRLAVQNPRAPHYGDIIKILLDNGADPNIRDDRNTAPLHVVCNNDTLKPIAELLLHHCADPNLSGPNNSTPLHITASRGMVRFSEILLKKGANINARDADGQTPLHKAIGMY